MHELSLTSEIVDRIAERLSEEGHSKATRVVLEIGVLTAILPDAVRFCFDLCSHGTEVEGAELEIIETLASGECQECGRTVESKKPYVLCDCGSASIGWRTGQELKIREVEVV